MYKIRSNPASPVECFYSIFDTTGTENRGWSVTEVYSGATVFRDSGNCPTRRDYQTQLVCDPREGVGAELSSLVGLHFNFDDGYDEVEQTAIRNEWLSRHRDMLKESHWRLEEEYIKIPGGFAVDLVRSNGSRACDVVERNITLCNFRD